ncbi:PREDICTED: uncharacterized protein LOC104597941 isoform X2 [Nelumbo nucifera]|nr:PREDICTED: uncharacterized protein LOC104597941 isoform X2 [Nelumbo nucifera]
MAAFKDDENSSHSSSDFEDGTPQLTSSPELSDANAEFNFDCDSTKQSPQIQMMDRPEDPDPYRIPSSVFARSKSKTPMEWSVASNESLFSIHVGNSSFSRDFLMGRSDELGRSGDLSFPGSPSPVSMSPSYGNNNTDLGDSLGVAEAAAETMKEVIRATAEKESVPSAEVVRQSSHRSDVSGSSIKSFAFPILTAEGGRNGSVKVESDETQQPQPQPTTEAPKPAQTSWFSCFSCCPFCS